MDFEGQFLSHLQFEGLVSYERFLIKTSGLSTEIAPLLTQYAVHQSHRLYAQLKKNRLLETSPSNCRWLRIWPSNCMWSKKLWGLNINSQATQYMYMYQKQNQSSWALLSKISHVHKFFAILSNFRNFRFLQHHTCINRRSLQVWCCNSRGSGGFRSLLLYWKANICYL